MTKTKLQIDVPILNNEYWVYVYWGDKETCLKEAKKYFDDEINIKSFEGKRGLTLLHESKNPIIWIGLSTKDKHFYSTLAHEAIHAVDHIWDDIGEKNGDEIFAHSVGAVVYAVENIVKS